MNIASIQKKLADHSLERLKASRAPRDAAVILPLVEDTDGRPAVLFEVRSRSIIQGGEICFPGGRIEKGEKPELTAVRELCEELNTASDNVELISPLFVMNSMGDSNIYSYLGRLKSYDMSYSAEEVESIFTVSVDELLRLDPKQSRADFVFDMPEDFHYELVPGGKSYPWARRTKDYYFYETRHGVIWGITGEILHGFIELLRK